MRMVCNVGMNARKKVGSGDRVGEGGCVSIARYSRAGV